MSREKSHSRRRRRMSTKWIGHTKEIKWNFHRKTIFTGTTVTWHLAPEKMWLATRKGQQVPRGFIFYFSFWGERNDLTAKGNYSFAWKEASSASSLEMEMKNNIQMGDGKLNLAKIHSPEEAETELNTLILLQLATVKVNWVKFDGKRITRRMLRNGCKVRWKFNDDLAGPSFL